MSAPWLKRKVSWHGIKYNGKWFRHPLFNKMIGKFVWIFPDDSNPRKVEVYRRQYSGERPLFTAWSDRV